MEKRGGHLGFVGGDERFNRIHILFIISLFIIVPLVHSDLGPENLLILVNSDSATSRYVTKLYRQYYPAITNIQVLELNGLPDCSGPGSTAADEIITRTQYDTLIAGPLRQHLLDNNLIEQIMVIVTTAGMPYRIEDTNYPNVIYPAGSNYNDVSNHVSQINAASVESELTCLWYADLFGLANRIVNPYQGYRNSSVTLFERLAPGTKPMTWSTAIATSGVAPKMEGTLNFMSWPPSLGTIDRNMHVGDIYLTCRLDGPKAQGKSAVFEVHKMLERSKRVSNPAIGLNAQLSVSIIDDAPNKTLDANRVYNLDGSMNYYTFNPDTSQPPDAPTVLTLDDYITAYQFMTNQDSFVNEGMSTGYMSVAYEMKVLLDRRASVRTSQSDLLADETVSFYCCYGKNGDEGSLVNYLLEGLNDGPLFIPSNGSVFTSIESFNALTMFSGLQTAPVSQGKIVDFITLGGSGAVGHAFEPMSSGVIDNAYVAYNLFADSDMDGQADLSFVESVFTGIPFLSWSEVTIGDPLMRIAYGPGEATAWEPFEGDINGDNKVNFIDIIKVRIADGALLYTEDISKYNKYNDLCDINQDGKVNFIDVIMVRLKDGTAR